jgi:hypothetical protein
LAARHTFRMPCIDYKRPDNPPKGHQPHEIVAPEFGENVGVEQPTDHTETSRTGIGARFGSSSMSRYGEAWIAAIRASPLGFGGGLPSGSGGDFTFLLMLTRIVQTAADFNATR